MAKPQSTDVASTAGKDAATGSDVTPGAGGSSNLHSPEALRIEKQLEELSMAVRRIGDVVERAINQLHKSRETHRPKDWPRQDR